MIDGRYDIIATGSLIGLRGYNKKKSKGVPTGFEYTITMYPMDFEEYLCVGGIQFAKRRVIDLFYRKNPRIVFLR